MYKGVKELSPALNLRKLYETETLSSEPILVIISPGVDPSQVRCSLTHTILITAYVHTLCVCVYITLWITVWS